MSVLIVCGLYLFVCLFLVNCWKELATVVCGVFGGGSGYGFIYILMLIKRIKIVTVH